MKLSIIKTAASFPLYSFKRLAGAQPRKHEGHVACSTGLAAAL
jgi:hypothetical protein